MSTQGGIWSKTGAPVDPRVRAALRQSLRFRGPDGYRDHCDQSIVLAYGVFDTNGQSCSEVQPTILAEGLALTFDGRLDNTDELRRKLGLSAGTHLTVPEVVLRGYVRWGRRCFDELIGDWALVLWDRPRRKVLLARDFFGVRPLHYRIDRDRVEWSSELATFITLDRSIPPLNDAYLAGFLLGYPGPCETPYRDVKAVPPGNVVVCSDSGLETFRLWWPSFEERLEYARDEDYDNHFRWLFSESVRARMRSSYPVWIELSGGLDSSSIACVAHELSDETVSRQLSAVTYVFPHSVSADERNFSLLVERDCGLSATHIEEQQFSLFFTEDAPVPIERPQPGAGRVVALCNRMLEARARVLLTGSGGDAVMWSMSRPCHDLADLIVRLHPIQFSRRLSEYHRREGVPYWSLLWRDTLLSILGSQTRLKALRLANPWMNWNQLRSLDLSQLAADTHPRPLRILPSKWHSWLMLVDSARILSANEFRNCALLEAYYPFLDRRLVQFLLSIPFDQKRRPGTTRLLHRRALSSILPREITARRSKVGAEEPVTRALAREWPRVRGLFESGTMVGERELVLETPLRETVDRAHDGRVSNLFSLIRVIALEAWHQDLQRTLPSLFSKTAEERHPVGQHETANIGRR